MCFDVMDSCQNNALSNQKVVCTSCHQLWKVSKTMQYEPKQATAHHVADFGKCQNTLV